MRLEFPACEAQGSGSCSQHCQKCIPGSVGAGVLAAQGAFSVSLCTVHCPPALRPRVGAEPRGVTGDGSRGVRGADASCSKPSLCGISCLSQGKGTDSDQPQQSHPHPRRAKQVCPALPACWACSESPTALLFPASLMLAGIPAAAARSFLSPAAVKGCRASPSVGLASIPLSFLVSSCLALSTALPACPLHKMGRVPMLEGVGQEAELSMEITKHLRGVGVRASWCCAAQGPGPSACEPHRERDPSSTCIPCRDAPCSPCSSLAALGSAQCLELAVGRNHGLGQPPVLTGMRRDCDWRDWELRDAAGGWGQDRSPKAAPSLVAVAPVSVPWGDAECRLAARRSVLPRERQHCSQCPQHCRVL